jgi:N-acetylneuraminate synthase
MFGPDVPASIVPDELRQLVEGIRFIEKMRANPVDKEAMAADAMDLRKMFTKSIVARRNIKSGTILTNDDLTLKKPGTGIPAVRLPEIVGRRAQRSIAADTLISEEDFE